MKKSKVDLSIIILNYNAEKFLKKCLETLQDSNLGSYTQQIIVIDNASIDGSLEMLNKHFPKVTIIKNETNMGFARGNNVGVKLATGRYILFLNPDTETSPDVLKNILDYLEINLEVAVATPKLVAPDGSLDEPCHRGFPTPWRAFCHFGGLEKLAPNSKLFGGYIMGWAINDENSHEVESVSGAFFLIRREAGKEIGWWDEDYFWYGEDLDFCYRLNEKGWKIVFLPNLKVLHYRGISSGIVKRSQGLTTASKDSKIRSAKASTVAMKIFYGKHYKQKYPFFVTWLVLGGVSLMQTYRVAKNSI